MQRTTAGGVALAALLLTSPALADHGGAGPSMAWPSEVSGPIELLEGWQKHHHPISTRSARAQRFFDQGLLLLMGFNHADAIRSFEQAHELDPDAAMPLWGIAYALGSHINMPADADSLRRAYETVQQALVMSEDGPERERAYIEALATRYAADPEADQRALARAFFEAMAELHARFPDDLDAATFYAESGLNLYPWAWWSRDGEPADGVLEAIEALEYVLVRDYRHPGANHLYIHAVEASPNPERALEAARQLDTLVPASGHLVHMPSHIYLLTGRYAQAVESNQRAVEADRTHFEAVGSAGLYPLMYHNHNIHLQVAADMLRGRYGAARAAGEELVDSTYERVPEMPGLGRWFADYFAITPLLVDARFGMWDRILAAEAPEDDLLVSRGFWHYAQGLAHAARGELDQAREARAALEQARADLPEGYPYGQSPGTAILELAGRVLDGRIAAAEGDLKGAVLAFEEAVEIHDTKIEYMEPPDWYYPVRESLGAALLADDRAAEAEAVFREDLERTPRNARSLLGLAEALEAQDRHEAAQLVYSQYQDAWRDADVGLSLEDL